MNEIINDIGMQFVLIPAGEFVMGTSQAQVDAVAGDQQSYRNWMQYERPQHRVVISRPFYLGKYPVTQGQWQAVMSENPSRFKAGWKSLIGRDHAAYPVERVSWNEAQEFLTKLNERDAEREYVLPTEAQWEYACRAGSGAIYHFGDDAAQLHDYAWYGDNSGGKTRPVGQKQPNAWGLYDMHGNVWEWCQDRYGPYADEAATDPKGPETGAVRIIRGGSWADAAQDARSAHRNRYLPEYRFGDLGFRCVCVSASEGD